MRKTHLGQRDLRRASRDVESYLRGTYLEDAAATSGPVPAWCWLNALAHGTIDDLEEVCRPSSTPSSGFSRPWALARQLLAFEVLSVVGGSDAALRRLQHEVLIPYESRLIDEASARPRTPAELITNTRSLLPATSS